MKIDVASAESLPGAELCKRCTSCGVMKGSSEYTRVSSGKVAPLGRQSQCKECKSLQQKERYRKLRGEHLEYQRSYQQSEHGKSMLKKRRDKPVNKVAKAAYDRQRYLNSKSTRKKYQDLSDSQKRNRKLNERLRRSRLAGAVGHCSSEQWEGRLQFYGGKCAYCGRDADSVDHRIPVSRGGSNWPSNLLPSCISCNSRKNCKTEMEFRRVIAQEGAAA